MLEHPVLTQQAAASNKERFLREDFNKDTAFIKSLSGYKTMSALVLSQADVREGFAALLMNIVWDGFKK